MDVTKGDISPILNFVVFDMSNDVKEKIFGESNTYKVLQQYSIEDVVEKVIIHWRNRPIVGDIVTVHYIGGIITCSDYSKDKYVVLYHTGQSEIISETDIQRKVGHQNIDKLFEIIRQTVYN